MLKLKSIKIIYFFIVSNLLFFGNAEAFLIGNSQKCTHHKKAYKSEVNLTSFQEVNEKLTVAAGKIDALESEPMAFAVDLTAGSAVRATMAGVDVLQEGSEAIYKIATFAAETPQCTSQANNAADGVDCIIQLPNKTITMTLVATAEIGKHIIVGVYDVGSGVLRAAEDLSIAISDNLKNAGSFERALSVPFAIIGVIANGAERLAEIVIYDTVGGTFSNFSKAFLTVGTDICDILRSLTQLRIDQVLYHSVGLVVDSIAEGINIVLHIITLGNYNWREGRENLTNFEKLDVKETDIFSLSN
jgi:hypothetical protein